MLLNRNINRFKKKLNLSILHQPLNYLIWDFMFLNKKYFYIIFFALIFAVPSYPGKINFNQPNGIQFSGYIKGDEWQNWHENTDGYKIGKDKDGYWKYVKSYIGSVPHFIDVLANDIPPSGLDKNIKPERLNNNINFLENSFQVDNNREIWYFPLLLIDFPDMEATYSVETFDDLLNQEGYVGSQGPTGSYRDFYLEISYGQFNAYTDVMGWYTSSQPHIYYGDDTPNSSNRVREMIGNAIDEAEAQGVDWSEYDNDGNGYVDGINIVHAGQGAEEGDGSNIWSHKWNLGPYARYYDGVWIDSYAINPEKQDAGYNGFPGLTHIGVICHEFGHALGLPDLYDTDNSSSGIGTWGLMSGGSWGGNGSSPWYPAHMSAWAKVQLGWVDPIVLDDEISITLDINNVEENPIIFKLNGPYYTNQYFLFENRQKIGSDQTLKNSGLLIWHINDSQNNNTNDYNRLVDLEQADGLFQLNDGTNNGDLSDPYPGVINVNRFANETTPSSQYNNGTTSNIIVKDIVEVDGVITATFQNMPSLNLTNVNSIEIVGDNDGIVNPNETFLTFFELENPSNMNINNLEISFSSESEYITISTQNTYIGDLNGNSTTSIIQVSGAIDISTPPIDIPIEIEITGQISGGNIEQYLTLYLNVSLNQIGFPIDNYGGVKSSPAVIDLDNDGNNEIIFGTMNGYLVVLKSDGTLFSSNWPINFGGQFWASPAVADIDNDGIQEIIIPNHNKNLYIVDSDGNVEMEYYLDQFLVGTPSLGNFDEDNDLEIVVTGIGQNASVFVLNYDASDVQGFPININENIFTGASLSDFNENGLDDIVIGTNDGNIYLFYDNGQIADGFPFNSGSSVKSEIVIANIIGSEIPEITFGNDSGHLYCLKSNGDTHLLFNSDGPIKTTPAIINDNNEIKIFFGTTEGTLFGIDANGDSLSGWPKHFTQDILVSPVFSDFNNDELPEIVSSTKTGEFIIYDLLGNSFYPEIFSSGIITESQPTIFDFDNDGDLEIFIGNQNGLTGIDIKYQGELNSWHIFKGNNHRTGYFHLNHVVYPGDSNMDGLVNIIDILIILNYILFDIDMSNVALENSDYNSDSSIDVTDIVSIVYLILN